MHFYEFIIIFYNQVQSRDSVRSSVKKKWALKNRELGLVKFVKCKRLQIYLCVWICKRNETVFYHDAKLFVQSNAVQDFADNKLYRLSLYRTFRKTRKKFDTSLWRDITSTLKNKKDGNRKLIFHIFFL